MTSSVGMYHMMDVHEDGNSILPLIMAKRRPNAAEASVRMGRKKTQSLVTQRQATPSVRSQLRVIILALEGDYYGKNQT